MQRVRYQASHFNLCRCENTSLQSVQRNDRKEMPSLEEIARPCGGEVSSSNECVVTVFEIWKGDECEGNGLLFLKSMKWVRSAFCEISEVRCLTGVSGL